MGFSLEHYSIAIRKKGNNHFWEEENATFDEICFPFSDRYWAADPFVIENNNKVYLFYEYFDNVSSLGKIAYSILDGNIASRPIVVLDKPYHLSFPNVFLYKGDYYMIPETAANHRIEMYKAESFPDKWKLDKVLVESVDACDTIVYPYNNGLYMMTSIMDRTLSSQPWCYVKNQTYYLNESDHIELLDSEHSVGDYGVRNGGNYFCTQNGIFRIGQNCKDGDYGKGFVIWRSLLVENKEDFIKSFLPEDIEKLIVWHDLRHTPIKGTHTYNCSQNYEVIDTSEIRNYNRIIKFKYKFFRIVRKIISKSKYLFLGKNDE